jgi:hypothetical protein
MPGPLRGVARVAVLSGTATANIRAARGAS